MAAARASGRRVEDRSQRDTRSRVFANPNGTWTAEISSAPVRVRDADGVWHDIDTRLGARDGGLAPAWAVADVVFSAGGDRTFASLTEGVQTLRWRWPTLLPEPVVDGSTATYRDVVPGGDLVVTATPTGFEHDVVLRRAPEGPVEFTMPVVTGDATLSKTDEDGLEIVSESGKALVSAPPPLMWDATTDDAGEPANVVEVATRVAAAEAGESTLTLDPGEGFLTDPDTVYPVTIDPTYRVEAASDGWIWNADVTDPAHPAAPELKVGTQNSGGTKYQSYLRFDQLGAVAGKEILSANLVLRNFYSLSCQSSPIRVRKITSAWHLHEGFPDSLRWNNQPSVGDVFTGYAPAHGAGPACPTGNATWPVKFAVAGWAAGGDNHGLRLTAAEPNLNKSWRRYRSDNFADWWRRPKLTVTYNDQPTTPTDLGLVRPCVGDCAEGVSSSLTPTLSARSSDPDGNPLWYAFEVAPAGTTTPVATGTVGPAARRTRRWSGRCRAGSWTTTPPTGIG